MYKSKNIFEEGECYIMEDNICQCEYCKNNKDFDMPEMIIKAINDNNLVIFAGAGVSTESKTVYKSTLYEQILDELSLNSDDNLTFSELMSRYCKKYGKNKLLQKIKQRIDYVYSFPELYREASKFHRELSTIYQISEIITTNWDDLFERECGAIPFVSSEDFVFWNTPGRKVLKIHGSINNYGSIVATKEDYNKCYTSLNTGILGSCLKMLLATKTILFIGYSLNDEDFNKIYDFLRKEMGDLIPRSYIVTIDKESEQKLKKIGLYPIFTDATYFLISLKKHLINENLLMDDKYFDDIYYQLQKVKYEHNKLCDRFNFKSNPETMYCSSYQDGFIHALERILIMKKTGEYSNVKNVIKVIDSYADLAKQKLDKGIYVDVAYIHGYIAGLTYLISDKVEREGISVYYIYGLDKEIRNIDEYSQLNNYTKENCEKAYNFALNIVNKLDENSNLELHHTPFL